MPSLFFSINASAKNCQRPLVGGYLSWQDYGHAHCVCAGQLAKLKLPARQTEIRLSPVPAIVKTKLLLEEIICGG